MSSRSIFIICGNCRTFIDCFDNQYRNIISKLFEKKEYKIYVYLYLKLTDPGPKGQDGWNFSYDTIIYDDLLNKINEFKIKYTDIEFDYKIIKDNEISDEELLAQVKDRSKYISYYANDNVLLRGLHCHYNFECCGKYLLNRNENFDYIIYLRPDLYFTDSCESIDNYDNSKITLGYGPNNNCNDHIAIIPKDYFTSFFFSRMNLYRTNTDYYVQTPEEVYCYTINNNVRKIGDYYIKRQ